MCGILQAEVTAVVEKTVGFPFMADFQYRAPQGMSTLSAGFVDYFKGSGGAGEDIEPEDMFG